MLNREVVVHVLSPSTQETETESLGLRSNWTTEQVSGQPGLLHRNILPHITNRKTERIPVLLILETIQVHLIRNYQFITQQF